MSSSSDAPARARVRQEHEVHASPHELPELRTFMTTFDVRRVGIPDALLDEALASARVEGYEAGHAEALIAAELDLRERRAEQQAIVERTLRGLDHAAERLLAMQDSLDARLAERVSDVAFGIAEALVGHALASATHPGRDAIARALSVAPTRTAVTVRLNPEDVEDLDGSEEQSSGRSISLVADPAVARGDAVAELDTGEIDAAVDAALERVRLTLGGQA